MMPAGGPGLGAAGRRAGAGEAVGGPAMMFDESIQPVSDGAAAPVPCRGCGAAFTPGANPRYCDARLPALADRLRRAGTFRGGFNGG